MPETNQKLASHYGNAGLVPFVLCAGAVWVLPEAYALPASQVFACYSTIILSFLGGVLWGTALQKEAATGSTALLRTAIAASLIAWVTLIIAMIPGTTFGNGLALSVAINGLAYMLLRQSEQKHGDPHYPEWFIPLREWLNRVVLASHLSVAVFVIQL